jgi:hypothetical protein
MVREARSLSEGLPRKFPMIMITRNYAPLYDDAKKIIALYDALEVS